MFWRCSERSKRQTYGGRHVARRTASPHRRADNMPNQFSNGGRDEAIVPIPGARTEAQVKENAGAMVFGPLTPEQMAEIDTILER